MNSGETRERRRQELLTFPIKTGRGKCKTKTSEKCQNNDKTQRNTKHKMQSASICQHHCPFTANTHKSGKNECTRAKNTELFAICETKARISECNMLVCVCRTQSDIHTKNQIAMWKLWCFVCGHTDKTAAKMLATIATNPCKHSIVSPFSFN